MVDLSVYTNHRLGVLCIITIYLLLCRKINYGRFIRECQSLEEVGVGDNINIDIIIYLYIMYVCVCILLLYSNHNSLSLLFRPLILMFG